MEVIKAIKTRRTVREFLPDEIPRKDIQTILDAARFAPTAGNLQPWKFLIIRDKDNMNKLKTVVKQNMILKIKEMEFTEEEKKEHIEGICLALDKLFNAPVWILLFVDMSQYPELVIYDGALAAQNLMLTAHALGYGSSLQTSYFPESLIKDFFTIPDQYKFICAIPLGRPSFQPSYKSAAGDRPVDCFGIAESLA